MAIPVKLEVFEGPLDLLLDLIEKAELDITVLSLAQVTDQFLEYVRAMEEENPTEVSAFVVIAARLIQIKSAALLPRQKLNIAEAEQKMQNVIAYTEKLRANYQNANAVFTVEQVQSEKGGFLKPPIYYATGSVIYGYFDPSDQVQLKHGGNAFDLELENVLKIGSIGVSIGNNTVQGIGGTQCVLQFSGKGIECAPGDLIVRR